MSGDRGETNHNAEVISDARGDAIRTALPRRTGDHVFAPFAVRVVYARTNKNMKVLKTIKMNFNMTGAWRESSSVSK